MIDEAKYKKLKKQAEEARSDRDRATGQLEAIMARLHDEYDCDTIEQAEKKLTKLTKAAKEAEAAYDSAVEEFEEQWGVYAEDA